MASVGSSDMPDSLEIAKLKRGYLNPGEVSEEESQDVSQPITSVPLRGISVNRADNPISLDSSSPARGVVHDLRLSQTQLDERPEIPDSEDQGNTVSSHNFVVTQSNGTSSTAASGGAEVQLHAQRETPASPVNMASSLAELGYVNYSSPLFEDSTKKPTRPIIEADIEALSFEETPIHTRRMAFNLVESTPTRENINIAVNAIDSRITPALNPVTTPATDASPLYVRKGSADLRRRLLNLQDNMPRTPPQPPPPPPPPRKFSDEGFDEEFVPGPIESNRGARASRMALEGLRSAKLGDGGGVVSQAKINEAKKNHGAERATDASEDEDIDVIPPTPTGARLTHSAPTTSAEDLSHVSDSDGMPATSQEGRSMEEYDGDDDDEERGFHEDEYSSEPQQDTQLILADTQPVADLESRIAQVNTQRISQIDADRYLKFRNYEEDDENDDGDESDDEMNNNDAKTQKIVESQTALNENEETDSTIPIHTQVSPILVTSTPPRRIRESPQQIEASQRMRSRRATAEGLPYLQNVSPARYTMREQNSEPPPTIRERTFKIRAKKTQSQESDVEVSKKSKSNDIEPSRIVGNTKIAAPISAPATNGNIYDFIDSQESQQQQQQQQQQHSSPIRLSTPSKNSVSTHRRGKSLTGELISLQLDTSFIGGHGECAGERLESVTNTRRKKRSRTISRNGKVSNIRDGDSTRASASEVADDNDERITIMDVDKERQHSSSSNDDAVMNDADDEGEYHANETMSQIRHARKRTRTTSSHIDTDLPISTPQKEKSTPITDPERVFAFWKGIPAGYFPATIIDSSHVVDAKYLSVRFDDGSITDVAVQDICSLDLRIGDIVRGYEVGRNWKGLLEITELHSEPQENSTASDDSSSTCIRGNRSFTVRKVSQKRIMSQQQQPLEKNQQTTILNLANLYISRDRFAPYKARCIPSSVSRILNRPDISVERFMILPPRADAMASSSSTNESSSLSSINSLVFQSRDQIDFSTTIDLRSTPSTAAKLTPTRRNLQQQQEIAPTLIAQLLEYYENRESASVSTSAKPVTKIFAGCAFASTGFVDDRVIKNMIVSNGGIYLDHGLSDLFCTSAITNSGLPFGFRILPRKDLLETLEFVAIIAHTTAVSARAMKVTQARALGWPCLPATFIEKSVVKGRMCAWRPMALFGSASAMEAFQVEWCWGRDMLEIYRRRRGALVGKSVAVVMVTKYDRSYLDSVMHVFTFMGPDRLSCISDLHSLRSLLDTPTPAISTAYSIANPSPDDTAVLDNHKQVWYLPRTTTSTTTTTTTTGATTAFTATTSTTINRRRQKWDYVCVFDENEGVEKAVVNIAEEVGGREVKIVDKSWLYAQLEGG
ncbi:uncharacterized protein V2V93DRAFT_373239 [Kockiozyma suomiensis]|uniref:uncharacterized protein n=1 Tax=Kockiozyma suomiensis TaxID=1337062 RepID=UPI0033435D61